MGTLQRLKTALSSSNLIGRKKILARKRTNLLICDKFTPSVLFSTSFWSLAVIIDSKRRLGVIIDPKDVLQSLLTLKEVLESLFALKDVLQSLLTLESLRRKSLQMHVCVKEESGTKLR